MANVPFTPAWREHEAKIRSEDANEAIKAAGAFDEERQKELKTSKRARNWEAARKEHIAQDKPLWKQEQIDKEIAFKKEVVDKIKNGGSIKTNIRPARGYLLVQIIQEHEKETDSGIVLPNSEMLDNRALVVAVGDDLILEKNILPKPVEVGETVLLKKFAGMDIDVKGSPLKLVQFTDVLGILED